MTLRLSDGDPIPPVILVNGHDLMIFESVADAERFLEPWSVDNSTRQGFDAVGRPLRFRVEQQRPRTMLGKILGASREGVRLHVAEAARPYDEVVREALRQFLTRQRAGRATELVDWTLAELVAEVRRVTQPR